MGAGTMASKFLKGGAGNLLNDAIDIGGAALTMHSSRKQGDSIPVSIAKTGFDFAIGAMMPWQMQLAYSAITVGYDMMLGMSKMNAEAQKQMKTTGSGRVGSGTFNMSGAGYTMRQRGLNQLRSNGMNTQNVLGNEARNYIKAANSDYR